MSVISTRAMKAVVVSFNFTPAFSGRLVDLLGPDWAVFDLRDAPRSAELVLVGRCSPQAITRLRREFPRAQIVTVDSPDAEHTPDVCRCLSAGAASHVSMGCLAAFLAEVASGRRTESHQVA